MVKRVIKAVYVLVIALLESLTVSFYKNVKKRYEKPNNEYREINVPKGYKDKKLEPEYKDMSANGEFSDFSGLPGFK
ncbi:hypothetical protein HZA98_01405 [Candidatus Woesearchaeota archaeon]|nr:hypothetical protein [Candidatus Woesearchaeota archaeon]